MLDASYLPCTYIASSFLLRTASRPASFFLLRSFLLHFCREAHQTKITQPLGAATLFLPDRAVACYQATNWSSAPALYESLLPPIWTYRTPDATVYGSVLVFLFGLGQSQAGFFTDRVLLRFMLHVVGWAAPEAWRRLWCSGPPYFLEFWCFCAVRRPPKAQTHAVTSSVDPTTPFLQAAIAPCDVLSFSIAEAHIRFFLHWFFLHDDESEALACLPCTPSFSEAKPFLDTHTLDQWHHICLLHRCLLPWSPSPVDRSVSLFWQSATSYLDRCQASQKTAARSMGPVSGQLH